MADSSMSLWYTPAVVPLISWLGQGPCEDTLQGPHLAQTSVQTEIK